MKTMPTEVNYTEVARNLRYRFGAQALTERYNEWRTKDGLEEVDTHTIQRFCGAWGHDAEQPEHFKLFLAHAALCCLTADRAIQLMEK